MYEELRLKLAEALKAGSKRLLATYLQTLLAYPEGCTKGETVFDPRSGDVIVQVPPLSEDKLYPKEKALVDLVAAERMEGRRVLVYATHTGTRDITERMDDILSATQPCCRRPPAQREMLLLRGWKHHTYTPVPLSSAAFSYVQIDGCANIVSTDGR